MFFLKTRGFFRRRVFWGEDSIWRFTIWKRLFLLSCISIRVDTFFDTNSFCLIVSYCVEYTL